MIGSFSDIFCINRNLFVKRKTELSHFKLPQYSHEIREFSNSTLWPFPVQVQIQLSVVSRETDLKMTTNESYQLMIQTTDKITLVYIVADSFFGARHALETLSQLIAWDDTVENYLLVSDSVITDSPAFVHRGFLVDTSRNFINVN